jgi:hypothetical protein
MRGADEDECDNPFNFIRSKKRKNRDRVFVCVSERHSMSL